jgi:peptidase E
MSNLEFNITYDGYEYISKIQKSFEKLNQAFIAMSFDQDDKYTTFYSEAIVKVLKELDITPVRIDMKEHNEQIVDEILNEIQKSAFMIADFTGNKAGVYFEAG